MLYDDSRSNTNRFRVLSSYMHVQIYVLVLCDTCTDTCTHLQLAHAANMPPRLEGDDTFMITVGQPSVYTFTVTDENDNVMPMIEGGLPPNADLANDGSMYTLTWLLMSSDLIDFNQTIRITARDSLNASSLLVPQLQICACNSVGGNCTLEGLIDIVANPLILNCECSLGKLSSTIFFFK